MARARDTLALGLASLSASAMARSVASCGGALETPQSMGASEAGTGADADLEVEASAGSVGFRYTVPGGERMSQVRYSLGNGSHTYLGVAEVGPASAVSFIIGGVAAGSGYTIVVDGTTDDGLDVCSGCVGTGRSDIGIDTGAPFAVPARTSTWVDPQPVCVDLPGSSVQSPPGEQLPCPYWDTLIATPSEGLSIVPDAGRNTSLLSGTASVPLGPDAGVQCTWSLLDGSGTVSPTTTDGAGNFYATFTCPQVHETDVVQMFCTDDLLPDGATCPTAYTTGTTGVICGLPCQKVGAGVVASPNSPGGACPAGQENTGSLTDGKGNYCCSLAPPAPCDAGRTGEAGGCEPDGGHDP